MQFNYSATFAILLSLVALASTSPVVSDGELDLHRSLCDIKTDIYFYLGTDKGLAKRDCGQACGMAFDSCTANGGPVRRSWTLRT
jgi:hypothetical protein